MKAQGLVSLQANPVAELKSAFLQLWHEDRNLSPCGVGNN
jgi:hypothetical protein